MTDDGLKERMTNMSNSDNSRIWHDTSIALIEFANRLKGTTSEGERLAGYLLLDVGVETLLRSFLAKSNVKTKSDKPNFHDLIDEVRQVVGMNINENDLEDAKRFHSFRNKIYHQGDGFFPGAERFDAYLELANRFLATLLPQDTLENKTTAPGDAADDIMEALRIGLLDTNLGSLKQDFQDLKVEISIAAEAVTPKFTTRRIEKGLKELLTDEDIDTLDLEIEEKHNEQSKKIEEFNKLTGINTKDVNIIDAVIYDVTYLYLLILLKNKTIDGDDIKKYIEYRKFVENFSEDPDKAAMEDKEKLGQFRDWAQTIASKLYAVYNNQKQ